MRDGVPEYSTVGALLDDGANVASAHVEPHRRRLSEPSTAAVYGIASKKGVLLSLVSARCLIKHQILRLVFAACR
jgi:hypothetical protein